MTVASRWCGITDKLQTTDGWTDMQATWLSIRKHSEPPSNLSDHETSKIIRVRWLGDRTASKTGITSSRCLLGGHVWCKWHRLASNVSSDDVVSLGRYTSRNVLRVLPNPTGGGTVWGVGPTTGLRKRHSTQYGASRAKPAWWVILGVLPWPPSPNKPRTIL